MTLHTKEYEFVHHLFAYVLNEHAAFQDYSSSFVTKKYAYSTVFTGQIGRTVLLLSHVFRQTFLKYFRIIFPFVVRSKKHFKLFLDSLSVAREEVTNSPYILEFFAILAIVTEFTIFCYVRGYEYSFQLPIECLTEMLVARNADFVSHGGWDYLKVEGIPFSRAYYVLQHLIKTSSPKLQLDPLVLVSEIVSNVFDASTNAILQDCLGAFPLFTTFLQCENSTQDSGHTDFFVREADLLLTLVDNDNLDENYKMMPLCKAFHFKYNDTDSSSSNSEHNLLVRDSMASESDGYEHADKNNDVCVKHYVTSDGEKKCSSKECESESSDFAKFNSFSSSSESLINSCSDDKKRSSQSKSSIRTKGDNTLKRNEGKVKERPKYYGMPMWQRKILQLRKQRIEKRVYSRHNCKMSECSDTLVKAATPSDVASQNFEVHIPVTIIPQVKTNECAQSGSDSNELHFKLIVFPNTFTNSSLSENARSCHREAVGVKTNPVSAQTEMCLPGSGKEAMETTKTNSSDSTSVKSRTSTGGVMKENTNVKMCDMLNASRDLTCATGVDLKHMKNKRKVRKGKKSKKR